MYSNNNDSGVSLIAKSGVEDKMSIEPFRDVVSVFERTVEHYPENCALRSGRDELTYLALNFKANSLSKKLIDNNVGKDSIVAIRVSRSINMIVAVIAVLKTGATFLPISSNDPTERVDYILQDSKANLLLTDSEAPNFPYETINVSDENIYKFEYTSLVSEELNSQRAYIIYTSGSTGNPKGTEVEHCALHNLAMSMVNTLGVTEDDNVLQFSELSFDVSLLDIFVSLLTGATLVLPPMSNRELALDFVNVLNYYKITIAAVTPALLKLTNSDNVDTLKVLITAGEACTSQVVDNWASKVRLLNGYGPTETTVITTVFDCTKNIDRLSNYKTIPIGEAINNVKIYIVDNNMKRLPFGQSGQLCIAGKGLARGYLNNAGLNNEKFILANEEWMKQEGLERLYLSGDLAKQNSDGNFEYLGRVDRQIKIRGFRVEPGEIESAMLKVPGLLSVAVVNVAEQIADNKDASLTAFYCANIDYVMSNDELRKCLSNTLPVHMIPERFVLVEEMPLTSSGKIDYLEISKYSPSKKPQALEKFTPVEQQISDCFLKVLGVEPLTPNDDFHDLGGNSIKAIELATILTESFGKELPSDIAYHFGTIAQLARFLENSNAGSILSSKLKPSIKRIKGCSNNVFCFPPLFGYGHLYSKLNDRIPDCNLFGFNFVSDQNRTKLYAEEIMQQQSTGPYTLLGYSSGAGLAFEVAHYLQNLGEEVNDLVILDTPPKVGRVLSKVTVINGKEISLDDLSKFMAKSVIKAMELEGDIISKGMFSVVLKQVREVVTYHDSLDLSEYGIVNCNLHLLKSFEEDAELLDSIEKLEQWKELISGEFSLYMGGGQHYTMLVEEHVNQNTVKLNEIFEKIFHS